MTRIDTRSRFGPAMIATAVAVTGLALLLLVDHGPWSEPKAQNETMIQYGTTAAAAAAGGATVTTTRSEPRLEPVAPGPKPARPIIPDPSKS